MLRTLRAREVSAVELVDMLIGRIERHEAKLNALVVRDFDRARATARSADARRAAGDDGPLLGVPITVKDNLNVAGLRTTAGLPARADAPAADRDATSVGRLRAAGAMILGKTNLPPAASDYQTDNPIFGRTNNPHRVERTPGGSTGGGAALVAAGLSALEVGTDIGGSIRVPAAYCGVFGHKPTETLIPRDGQMNDFPVPDPAKVGNVQGALARDPEDLELATVLMAGPPAGEDVAWRVTLPPARASRLGDLRVALLPRIPWLPLASDIVAAIERLADSLSRLGARVGVAQPEILGDMKDAYIHYTRLIGATLAPAYPLERIEQMAQAVAGASDLRSALVAGMRATARDYLGWVDERERYRAAYHAFFAEWDLLIAPVSPVTAFPHDARPFGQREILVDGAAIPYGWLGIYPSVASIGGNPATVIPIGRDRDALPIGVQAIGPYLEDLTPLRAAGLIAAELGGYLPPPGFE
jgi:amidase